MTSLQKRKEVGFYGGKFIPLHSGHLYSILKAASMVEHLYVVVSYIEDRDKELCEQAGLPYVHYKQRALWIKQATKDLTNITVLYVEDIDMRNNDIDYVWAEGANRIKQSIPEHITHVFSSESSYDKWFRKNYGEDINHIIIDEARSLYNVSATKVRTEGVFSCWDMIPNVCKPFYTKKVAIVGVESCGKSTLVRNLAKLFNTNYVEEYGRVLSEELGDGSDLLTDNHYKEIVYGQKHREYRAVKESNKVMFIDSEAVVSQYYAKMYQGHELDFIESVIDTQDYDLYIYLEPDVEWVADGYRTFNNPGVRQKTNEILKEMFAQRNIEIVSVSGNYQERLDKCIELTTNLLYPVNKK